MSNAGNRDPDNGNSALALGEFFIPGGNDAARLIRALRTPEKGQLRMSPEARWIPLTAEPVIDSSRTSFGWEAKLDAAKTISPAVEDRVHDSHGRPAAKLMGIVPVKKLVGTKRIAENQGAIWRRLCSAHLFY